MRRTSLAPGALALALALFAAPAHAQYFIREVTISPATPDSAGTALARAVREDMDTILAAQDAYYAEHGRYAARLQDLPGARDLATVGVHYWLTAGRDWWVVLGGSHAAGMRQRVVSREPDAAAVAAEAGGDAPSPAGR